MNSNMLFYAITLVFASILVEVSAVSMVTFTVTKLDGRTINYTYPKQNSSDCIYSKRRDVLTCMYDYPYDNVTSVWNSLPESLRYISVNCRRIAQDRPIQNACVCKTASSVSRTGEKYSSCQLSSVTTDFFSTTRELELLDLSDNAIDTLDRNSFSNLPKLKYLSLNGNNLNAQDFQFGLFCDAENLEYLGLSELDMDVFPSHAFTCKSNIDSINFLDLSNSKIKDIPKDSMENLASVKYLDLSGNSLVQIYKGSFIGGVSLKHLNLEHNRLTYLFPYFCDYLPNMTHLHLQWNNFTTFDFEEVEGCSGLVSLNLSSNKIGSMSGNTSMLVSLKDLDLSNNNIVSLTVQINGLNKLESLIISKNKIRKLKPDQLLGLVNLVNIDLSLNSLDISNIFGQLFDSTEQLQHIDLHGNLIQTIPNNSFTKLKVLTTLWLHNNNITRIYSDSFSGLDSLETLTLDFNELETLPASLMNPLKKLKHFSVSGNKISTIEATQWQPLTSLDLSMNRLSRIPSVINYSNMVKLSISHNKLETFFGSNENILIATDNLLTVDLSFNNISDISPQFFQKSKKLYFLNLENNRLSWNLSRSTFHGADNLTVVNLAYNKIVGVSDIFSDTSLRSLTSLNVSSNPILRVSTLSAVGFKNATIQTIDLSKCNLKTLEQFVFKDLQKLAYVSLRDNKMNTFKPFLASKYTKYDMSGNPVDCTCNMSWLREPYVELSSIRIPVKNFKVPYCRVYTEQGLFDPSFVHRERYRCLEEKNCSFNCSCYKTYDDGDIQTVVCQNNLTTAPTVVSSTALAVFLDGNNFRGNESLNAFKAFQNMMTKELYLNKSAIEILEAGIFDGFSFLEILSLSNNDIKVMPASIFLNQKNLLQVYLNGNKLKTIEAGVFRSVPKLQELDISHNHLRVMHTETGKELSSLKSAKYFFLGNNEWECDCSNVALKNFVDNVIYKIRDRGELKCRLTKQEISYMRKSDFRCLETLKSTPPTASIIAIIFAAVVLLIVFAACFYFRRELAAMLYYVTKCRCGGKRYYPGMHFDVFVAFDLSNMQSSEYVKDTLIPRLQNNGFNCQTSLDLIADLEVTQKAIEDSRCSIFIVNKSFSSDTFLQRVYSIAQEMHRVDSRHRVILLIVGDIDLIALEPEVLKRLRKGDYITARSRLWWKRLVYELPDPSGYQHSTVNEQDNVSESDVIVFSTLSQDRYESI